MANLPAASSAHLLQYVGRVLESEGIKWATIGALAVAYHGWIRASMDADALITFKGSASDLDRISEKLREQGWKVDSRVGGERVDSRIDSLFRNGSLEINKRI